MGNISEYFWRASYEITALHVTLACYTRALHRITLKHTLVSRNQHCEDALSRMPISMKYQESRQIYFNCVVGPQIFADRYLAIHCLIETDCVKLDVPRLQGPQNILVGGPIIWRSHPLKQEVDTSSVIYDKHCSQISLDFKLSA